MGSQKDTGGTTPSDVDARPDSALHAEAAGNPQQIDDGVRLVTPFVGRERELAVLRAAAEDALSGKGSLVLVAGEPGIGKTRLVEHAAAAAKEKGLLTCWGRCWEGDGAPAFWPWVQVLRLLNSPTSANLESEPGGTLTHLLSDLDELVAATKQPIELTNSDQWRFRIFDNVSVLLRNLARLQPLFVVLDDLHSADAASLVLLQFLAQEAHQARLVMVGTYRHGAVAHSPVLSRVLTELARERRCEWIELQGLGSSEVGQFLDEIASRTTPNRIVRAVYDHTEGHPFYLVELAKILVAEGALARPDSITGPLVIPPTVRGTILQRIEEMSEVGAETLEIAAVIGRDFEITIMKDIDEQRAERLLELLDEGVSAGVLCEVTSTVGQYRFAHILVRDVLYERLPVAHRTTLHQRVARALEQRGSGSSGIGSLAHHLFSALPDGDPEKAVTYTIRAAEQATKLLAHEQAADQYQRAVRALDFVERDDTRRCELLLALGEAQNRCGDANKRNTFKQAAVLARTLERADLFARAALGFAWEVTTGYVDPELVSLLEEALVMLGKDEGMMRPRVLSRLARALYWSSESEHREASSREALSLARSLGDSMTTFVALTDSYVAMWGPDSIEERFTITEQMADLLKGDREPPRAAVAKRFRIMSLLELGSIAKVDTEIAAHKRIVERSREPFQLCEALAFSILRRLMRGDFEGLDSMIAEGETIAERSCREGAIIWFWPQQAFLLRERGLLKMFESTANRLFEQYAGMSVWRAIQCGIYASQARRQDASATFALLSEGEFAALPRDGGWLVGMAFLSEACEFLRDAERASTLHMLLQPFANRTVVVSWAAACMGSVSHFLGLLSATMSKFEASQAYFEEALRLNTALQAPPLVARTQLEYSRMLLARGTVKSSRRARDLLTEAVTAFDRLGMQECFRRALQTQQEHGIEQSIPRALTESLDNALSSNRNIPNEPSYRFRPEGDFWTLVYGANPFHVKDLRGCHYIAYLLRHPHHAVHVLDMIMVGGPEESTKRGDAEGLGLRIPQLDRGDPLLDPTARRAYQARLRDLRQERTEAEQDNDLGRLARVREEIDFLAAHLRSSTRPGGASRSTPNASERARINVKNSINIALHAIGKHDEKLFRHLRNSIKTGSLCLYAPDQDIIWEL